MMIYVLLTVQPRIQSFERKKYFFNLIVTNASVSTISSISDLIEGSGRANIMLPNGARFHINDALYSSKSTRNLLSFKDICKNGYHIETMNKGNKESLYITSIIYGKKIVAKKLPAFSSGSSMIRQIMKQSHGHPLKNQKILLPNEFSCDPCSQGKLIVRPSFNKIMFKSPVFLERIHGDICGPIHSPCEPFRYFMVLIDAST